MRSLSHLRRCGVFPLLPAPLPGRATMTASRAETARFGQPDGVAVLASPHPHVARGSGQGNVHDAATRSKDPAAEIVARRDRSGADFFARCRFAG